MIEGMRFLMRPLIRRPAATCASLHGTAWNADHDGRSTADTPFHIDGDDADMMACRGRFRRRRRHSLALRRLGVAGPPSMRAESRRAILHFGGFGGHRSSLAFGWPMSDAMARVNFGAARASRRQSGSSCLLNITPAYISSPRCSRACPGPSNSLLT